ncbi:prepilin peptidase [Rossellomorea vietnamensis]|uniref:prepilin peptidase n=1 Tax=Rossellomorea vietnamensis TaxID=218284 RepID=UPI001CCBC846|nr:A24 family peptidase [Rossellomorea vietnamensis]MCA0147428.1 prepilin peptidase [Rossellomorea vietnamensis]
MLILVILYALLLGSFYNVVGLRVPLKKSIVKPRSSCPYCSHQLTAIELLPVFSYLIQKGKCRRCHGRISPLYPFMEALNAGLFVLAYIEFGLRWELIVAWTLISLFIIITVSDLKYMVIPDKILLFFSALFLVERLFIPLTPWWDSLIGAAVGFGLLLLIAVVSKGGMGGGDIKIYALIGFVVGLKVMILSFMLATFFGAVFGLIALTFKLIERGKPIPFGPFIALGTILAYLYGDVLLSAYLTFFY